MMRTSRSGSAPVARRGFAPFSAPSQRSTSMLERTLRIIGADPAFVEAVLGDLDEEYAYRAERDGGAAARWWYVGETIRCAPHLARSWFRYAQLHARGQLAAVFAGLAVTSFIIVFAIVTRNGPPARLNVGSSNDILINNELPVHMPVQVLDARGHLLKAGAVRFQRISGAPIGVTPRGVITCNDIGDARLRISLGLLSKSVLIHCRPVHAVFLRNGDDMIEGDPARQLELTALAPDGRPIDLLAGTVTVGDSAIASLHGLTLQPRAAGRTTIYVAAGDHNGTMDIRVWQRMRTPSALAPFQAFSTQLRMPIGATQQWSVAPGRYDFSLSTDANETESAPSPYPQAGLTLATLNANCVQTSRGQRYMCVALHDAHVIVYAPRNRPSSLEFSGRLVVMRLED